MSDDGMKRRKAWAGSGPAKQVGRVKILAEAGADGRELTPVEVQEICRALQVRLDRVPTRFHSST